MDVQEELFAAGLYSTYPNGRSSSMSDTIAPRARGRKKFSPDPTPHGHAFDEATSALQKCIRRGLEDDALYWAVQLDLAGYSEYLWRRLRWIASEDIGLAEPMIQVQLSALYESWKDWHKRKGLPVERLFVIQAVMLCARAKKSRAVDHAFVAHYFEAQTGDFQFRREVPDVAIDKHTTRGKQLGRGWEEFLNEGSKIENAGEVDDPYYERWVEANEREAGVHEEEGTQSQPQLPVNGNGHDEKA